MLESGRYSTMLPDITHHSPRSHPSTTRHTGKKGRTFKLAPVLDDTHKEEKEYQKKIRWKNEEQNSFDIVKRVDLLEEKDSNTQLCVSLNRKEVGKTDRNEWPVYHHASNR